MLADILSKNLFSFACSNGDMIAAKKSLNKQVYYINCLLILTNILSKILFKKIELCLFNI